MERQWWLCLAFLAVGAVPCWGADDDKRPERPGPEAMFQHMDANHDGALSADELPAPLKQRFPNFMERADQNHDKKLDRKEFSEAMRGVMAQRMHSEGRGPEAGPGPREARRPEGRAPEEAKKGQPERRAEAPKPTERRPEPKPEEQARRRPPQDGPVGPAGEPRREPRDGRGPIAMDRPPMHDGPHAGRPPRDGRGPEAGPGPREGRGPVAVDRPPRDAGPLAQFDRPPMHRGPAAGRPPREGRGPEAGPGPREGRGPGGPDRPAFAAEGPRRWMPQGEFARFDRKGSHSECPCPMCQAHAGRHAPQGGPKAGPGPRHGRGPMGFDRPPMMGEPLAQFDRPPMHRGPEAGRPPRDGRGPEAGPGPRYGRGPGPGGPDRPQRPSADGPRHWMPQGEFARFERKGPQSICPCPMCQSHAGPRPVQAGPTGMGPRPLAQFAGGHPEAYRPYAVHPTGQPPMRALFARLDRNHDGQLSFEEFARGMAMVHHRKGGPGMSATAHARPGFGPMPQGPKPFGYGPKNYQRFDRDHDGHLSPTEMRHAMSMYSKQGHGAVTPYHGGQPKHHARPATDGKKHDKPPVAKAKPDHAKKDGHSKAKPKHHPDVKKDGHSKAEPKHHNADEAKQPPKKDGSHDEHHPGKKRPEA